MGAEPGSAGAVRIRQGDAASGSTGSSDPSTYFESFLAETSNGGGVLAFRATTRSTQSSSRGEGVWMQKSDLSTFLLLKKGAPLDGVENASVKRITNFWLLGQTQNDPRLLALVQLTGPGISAANDTALVLLEPSAPAKVILREGEFAPSAQGAKIGVITKVDADAWSGTYAVVATLAGTTAKTNLVVLNGKIEPNTLPSKMKPRLRLRKGIGLTTSNTPPTSFRFPVANHLSSGGAGCTGVARSIAWDSSMLIEVVAGSGRTLFSRLGP